MGLTDRKASKITHRFLTTFLSLLFSQAFHIRYPEKIQTATQWEDRHRHRYATDYHQLVSIYLSRFWLTFCLCNAISGSNYSNGGDTCYGLPTPWPIACMSNMMNNSNCHTPNQRRWMSYSYQKHRNKCQQSSHFSSSPGICCALLFTFPNISLYN